MRISKYNASGCYDPVPYYAILNIEKERKRMTASKYRNKKTVIDGITFDSRAEGRRYENLKLAQKSGAISGLEIHKRFKLYAGIVYEADFAYVENGRLVAEDVKGFVTKEFRLKKRLFNADYPDIELRIIKVNEV